MLSPNVTMYEDSRLNIAKTAIYSFIFVLGMFGNILVVRATRQYLTLRKPTNILICNLCICDMLIMLLGIPIFLFGENKLIEYFGMNSCRIAYPFLSACLFATVFTLVVIAVERYDAIVNSVRRKMNLTGSKAGYIIIFLDVLSILFALPLSLSNYKKDSHHCVRDWEPLTNLIFSITMFLLQYLIPLFVMVVLYSLCWHRIRKKNKATINISNKQRSISRNRSATENESHQKRMYISADHLPGEEETFMSGSKNHLSGIKRMSARRSFSADSVYDLQKEESTKISHRFSFNQKSATVDNNMSSMDRPASYCESTPNFLENHLKPKTRHSFIGSVQKFQQSLTSLIIGANGVDTLTVFAVQRMKQTLKTLRVFSIILLVFALCLLPHHVLHFMYTDIPIEAQLFEIFIYVYAAVNPWIYAGMIKSYRVSFAAMLRRRRRRQRKLSRLSRRSQPMDDDASNYSDNVRFFCWSKFMSCLQGDKKQEVTEFDYYDANSERRDTVKSLDGDFFSTRNGRHNNRFGSIGSRKGSYTGSRKDSKISSKDSQYSLESHIPFLAPIIIITNYDEEMAAQQACEVKIEDGNENTERFSAILSFHDA